MHAAINTGPISSKVLAILPRYPAAAHDQKASACCIKRLYRTIWKKWNGYHRRSLVETKMHCFELLGQRVIARTSNRQITELKILDRFSQIGTPNTIRIA